MTGPTCRQLLARGMLVAGALVVASIVAGACVPLPGEKGQPCNDYGFCAPGLTCSADNICIESASSCDDGICHESGRDCGWFVGPRDVSDAAELCEVAAGDYPLGETPTTIHLDGPFYLDRFEVTALRYRAFVTSLDATGQDANRPTCEPGDRGWQAGPDFYDARWANHPVVCVTRDQAAAYCQWAGKRLPTAREWEAAARGTDRRSYPWGNALPDGTRANCENSAGTAGYCNDTYPANTCQGASAPELCDDTAPIFDAAGEPTLPAGASPIKALHMAGNVWEWVSDDVANQGQLRGGSWADFFDELRVWSSRGVSADSYRKTTVGFRCAYGGQ